MSLTSSGMKIIMQEKSKIRGLCREKAESQERSEKQEKAESREKPEKQEKAERQEKKNGRLRTGSG